MWSTLRTVLRALFALRILWRFRVVLTLLAAALAWAWHAGWRPTPPTPATRAAVQSAGAAALRVIGGAVAAAQSAGVVALPPVADDAACVVAAWRDAVHDGDTLSCADGRVIRVLLVDAPELAQPGGVAARDALRALAPRGSVLQVRLDVVTHDGKVSPALPKGRLLAYLTTARGDAVNLALARGGWVVGLRIPPNGARDFPAIRDAIAEARAARRGNYADGGAYLDRCPPAAFRRGTCH